MPRLTERQLSDFYKITSEKPYSATQVAKYLKEKYKLREPLKRIYKQIYDYLTTQAGKLLFLTKKEDAILWIRANPQNSLTLIFDKQISTQTEFVNEQPPNSIKNTEFVNSGQHKKGKKTKIVNEQSLKLNKNIESDLEGLKNASPERWKAAHKVSRCNGFGYVDKETGDFIYTNNIYFECIKEFSDYISRIRTETIEMYHSLDGDPIFSEAITLPYKTRFTSQERQEEIRAAYRATWEAASRKHLKAVFLTLTAPPRANTLWHTNMNMLKAWSKLRRFLSKFLRCGLTYLCVREFQQNGRLHFHIVIFGTKWILPVHILKALWVSYGGGRIMNIRALTQEKAGWTWANLPPMEAKGQAPAVYLSEYLEKSMNPKSGLNYWIYNISYWTSSQDIKQSPERYESRGIWVKVGTIGKEGKRLFQKGNDKAKSFFAGALLRTLKRSEPKPKDKPKEIEKPLTGFRRASELFMQG